MSDRTITIERTIDDQMLADILITAVEGGIGYWSQVVTYRWTEGPQHTQADIVVDIGDGEIKDYKINLDVIEKGLKALLVLDNVNPGIRSMASDAVAENDAAHIDSDAADVIVQLGLLDEIVYG